MSFTRSLFAGLTVLLLAQLLPAQTPPPNGELLFMQNCALCHLGAVAEGVPNRDKLAIYETSAIMTALDQEVMRLQGANLTPAERKAIAEYLTGTDFSPQATDYTSGMCPNPPALAAMADDPGWRGWGPDVSNARFQTHGGLSAADVPRLELKWAFGVPGALQSRSQPTVAGGLLFMGSQSGLVVALDAKTGCTHWKYKAGAGVRTAIVIGPQDASEDKSDYAVYFADGRATMYALDAATGKELWTLKVEDHPAAKITGSPTLHAGRLYVGTAGVAEESTAVKPDYGCCTFRGSLTKLDAATGEVIWKTYTVPEPKPRGKNRNGVELRGPAGVSIWSAPTVDGKRGLVYAATGNAFADPPQKTSDAIVAFDLQSGAIRWASQPHSGDTWILGCEGPKGEKLPENPNCPKDLGPDYDFAASPALVTLAGGREVIIATQKSGLGYAFDPAAEGKLLWEYRWGQGSALGGVWGAATDGKLAYFATADILADRHGGLHAVDLESGRQVWHYPPPRPDCVQTVGCSEAQSAALSAIPGVVFTGAADGSIRAHASADGKLLWSHASNREYQTVNDVVARGGSIDGAGPVIAGGMLYVASGNGGMVGMRGNVLLAFGIREDTDSE
jgi:polyvinyl alcohol dehydrogenase (cytochrome)